MNFFQSIRICFAKYATTNGRAIRSEYWYFVLFIFIGAFVIGIFDAILFDNGNTPLFWLFILVILLPSISVTARRLHDVNRSGWWMLIPLTIIGYIPYIYWLIKKGDEEENKFGVNVPN